MTRYSVTVRRRGATERERFASLDEALVALEARLDGLARPERRAAERSLAREFEPAQQVAVRGELRGPGGLRAGIDVRGDGSAEAFRGVVRRRVIEAGDREDAWSALRRSVGS
jgi:hypothetical protein